MSTNSTENHKLQRQWDATTTQSFNFRNGLILIITVFNLYISNRNVNFSVVNNPSAAAITAEVVANNTNKPLNKMLLMMTTFNRIGYVQTFAHAVSLDPVMKHGLVDLFIRDAASTDYSIQELKAWFPQATNIVIETQRLRADENTRKNFEWFHEHASEYDFLINIDSDGYLMPGWWSFIHSHLTTEMGFATLYKSGADHHTTYNCSEGIWCHKRSTGGLGMVISNKLVNQMFSTDSKVKEGGGFDWAVIDWLTQRNIPIRAPETSFVLHYGMYGQNNNPDAMIDRADNFNMNMIHPDIKPCIEWWMSGNDPIFPCPKKKKTSSSKDTTITTTASFHKKMDDTKNDEPRPPNQQQQEHCQKLKFPTSRSDVFVKVRDTLKEDKFYYVKLTTFIEQFGVVAGDKKHLGNYYFHTFDNANNTITIYYRNGDDCADMERKRSSIVYIKEDVTITKAYFWEATEPSRCNYRFTLKVPKLPC